MAKKMEMNSGEMMCPGCHVPMSQCGCMGKMHVVKGLVLIVLGALLWWGRFSWFTLEHVVVLLLLLGGLKVFVWGCMSCKK